MKVAINGCPYGEGGCVFALAVSLPWRQAELAVHTTIVNPHTHACSSEFNALYSRCPPSMVFCVAPTSPAAREFAAWKP